MQESGRHSASIVWVLFFRVMCYENFYYPCKRNQEDWYLRKCEKVNNYEVVEKELHNHFKKQHIRGEWFKLNNEDIDFIKTYLDSNKN